MKLPVPGPRDVLGVLERGAEQVEALLGVVPRIVALLDEVEAVAARVGPILDHVEAVASGAEVVVTRANGVVDRADAVVRRTDGVVDRAEADLTRLTPLLDSLEPSLTKLQPTLQTLADTTHPDEVAALVQMVDHLPELTHRLETEIMPVMGTLGTVAPDLHDLLAVSRELNDMLAKIPGFGRIKKRIDEEQGEDETDATVRD